MTILKKAVIGDSGDVRIIKIKGVVDLSGVTSAEAHIWKDTGDKATLDVSVLSAEDCTLNVDLGGTTGWLATVATKGNYKLEYQLSFGAGKTITWPQEGPDQITVRDQGDATP